MGVGTAPAEIALALTCASRALGMAPRRTHTRAAHRGLLRGWASGPRPPNHHPSCADPARYVRSKARPILITVAAPDPIRSAVARGGRALASRDRASARRALAS